MCKKILKKIYSDAEACGYNKVVVITNHLKFEGMLCQDIGNDNDVYILSLSDVKMRRIEDICTCTEPDCNCNETNFCSLPLLNVNMDKVVAFSLME